MEAPMNGNGERRQWFIVLMHAKSETGLPMNFLLQHASERGRYTFFLCRFWTLETKPKSGSETTFLLANLIKTAGVNGNETGNEPPKRSPGEEKAERQEAPLNRRTFSFARFALPMNRLRRRPAAARRNVRGCCGWCPFTPTQPRSVC